MGRALVVIVALAVLFARAAAAQVFDVRGSVSGSDGSPLPGAHVYVAGSMIGTAARGDGTYVLEGLRPGAHRIVASMLGYEVKGFEIILRDRDRDLDFVLRPSVVEMAEVQVSAREDRRWQRRLERFQDILFGQSTFADSVRLLNPEVLAFRVRLGRLTATASAPLEIENRALGYRIRYDLTVFEAVPHRVSYDGEPFFEELTPRDPDEARRWAQARRIAYRGSQRHLFRSMMNSTLEEEGFYLVLRPDEGRAAPGRFAASGLSPRRIPINANRVIRPTDQAGEFRLHFRGLLDVVYTGEPEDDRFPFWEWNVDPLSRPRPDQRSTIFLEQGPTIVDSRGELADAFGITRMGYLAFRRLAMLLPVEYGIEPTR